jgi:phosphate transport system protein
VGARMVSNRSLLAGPRRPRSRKVRGAVDRCVNDHERNGERGTKPLPETDVRDGADPDPGENGPVEEMRHSYHEQLDELRADVIQLGRMATDAIVAGTDALLEADLAAADAVISRDALLDDLTHSIEERACGLLARQQPMASDLRTIVAVLRTIHEIERTGDLMVNVARTTRRLYPSGLHPLVGRLVGRMGQQAATQLRIAVEAFSAEDAAQALALPDMDDVMDELQRELFRTIFAMGDNDEDSLQRAVQTALVGRYYERIADHAVNVGQRVTYMVTGHLPSAGHGLGEIALG